MCKARLDCHDDVQLDVVCKAWASKCWPSAWTDVSRLMAVTLCVCVACRHAMWAMLVDGGGLRHGPSLPKHVETCYVTY